MMMNPAQKSVMEHGLLQSGFSVILQMPTGSGKTWLAKQALRESLNLGLRGVYLSPLKALAEELSNEWTQEFSDIEVGIFTGDYGSQRRKYPVSFEDAQLLVMTPERLDACVRKWRSHWKWIPEVDWLVVDEVHLLGDANRGGRLEGTLSRIRRLNPFCRVLGLSATLGNRSELADWIGGVEFKHDWRPVPLEWKEHHYRKAEEKINSLIEVLHPIREQGGQSIVFVQSRRRSEQVAQALKESGFQVSHHHAGLNQEIRRNTENAFRNQNIQTIVATGTLEMGLNLPARQVVLYDLHGFDGQGFTPLSVNTVWQRAGRAGRPGFDQLGEVVLLKPVWDRSTPKYHLGHFERIDSPLTKPHVLAEQILTEVYSGLSRTKLELKSVLNRSLAVFQKRSLKVDETIEEMLDSGMLREEERGEKTLLKVSGLAKIACRHQLQPQTILQLRTFLETFPAFTEFDLLVALTASPDCETVLSVDYEELEKISDEISHQSSFLFQNPSRVSQILKVDGKRLLSALKGALVLWRWTLLGDKDLVAEEDGCYPFEIQRLLESSDRLLLASGSIQKMLDEKNQVPEPNHSPHENSPSWVKIELIRQMLLNGIEQEAAGLTLIEGLGPVMVRRLLKEEIQCIEDLADADIRQLSSIKGLSEKRARKWIEEAKKSKDKVPAEWKNCLIQSFAAEMELSVDPYRLRRALYLEVNLEQERLWNVRGGSEPRLVSAYDQHYKCNCPDYAKGNHCKHIMAVQLDQKDPELTQTLEVIMASKHHSQLELYGLWYQ